MDPSAVELTGMTEIAHVLDWVGIQGTDLDVTSARGSFLTMLGMLSTQHPRLIAFVDEATFNGLVAAWPLVGQAVPTPAQRSMAGIVGRVCRIVCGTQQSQAQVAQQAAAAVVAAAAAVVGPKVRTVKLSSVLQQGNDEEAPIVPEAPLP